MGLLGRWLVFLVVASVVVGGNLAFLGAGEPPEEVPTEMSPDADEVVDAPADPVSAPVITWLGTEYPLAWDAYRRRIGHDLLKGDYYRQRLRERRTAESAEEPSIDPILGDLQDASEVSGEYLAESVNVESLLVDTATSGTVLEPVADLYAVGEWSGTMLEVSSELRSAQTRAFEQMESVIESGGSPDDRLAASNPGALSAGRALAYYRYVAEFGDESAARSAERYVERIRAGPMVYREEGLTVVEWRRGGNLSCPMMEPCRYEGSVEWSDGASLRYAGRGRSATEADPAYENRAYHVDRAFPRWFTVFEAHTLTSRHLERFLSGGTHYQNPLARRGVAVSVEGRVLTGPNADECPCIPAEARLAAAERTPEEHRRLQAFEEIAAARAAELRSRGDRLDAAYERLFTSGRVDDPSEVPPEVRRSVERYWYLRHLLTNVQSGYTEAAYNPEQGRYVDTETRIEAQDRMLSTFQSPGAFEDHVDGELSSLDAGIQAAEAETRGSSLGVAGGLGGFVDRFVAFATGHTWGPLLAPIDLGLLLVVAVQFLRLTVATVAASLAPVE